MSHKKITGLINNKHSMINYEDLFPEQDLTNTLVGANPGDIWSRLYSATLSQKPSFNVDGDVESIEFFKNSTQTEINRVARLEMTYYGSNPSTEVTYLYSLTDGVTVLKTITRTFTFSGDLLVKIEQEVS